MWKGNQQQSWQLTPNFADIKNLIQLQGLQLQIFKVPATFLSEAKAMAISASQYFVNVTTFVPNFIVKCFSLPSIKKKKKKEAKNTNKKKEKIVFFLYESVR